MTGHPSSPPARVAASLTDLTTGMWAALGIMAALVRRAATGEPQQVEAALVDSGYMLVSHQIMSMLATGEVPGPLGSASPIAAPYEAFRARNGWLMVAAGNQDLFERLCGALDLPGLVQDERFTTMAERVAHREVLHELLEARIVGDDAAAWIERLARAGVPVGPVNDLRAAVDEPVFLERGLLALAHDEQGPVGLPLVRLPVDRPATTSWTPPPRLGQHSAAVLAESGFSAAEIRELVPDPA